MHVLAIDQGTTGTTCLIVNERHKVVARAYREFPQSYPQPGWVAVSYTHLRAHETDS